MKQGQCRISKEQVFRSDCTFRTFLETWIAVVLLGCASLVHAQATPRTARPSGQKKAAETAPAPAQQPVANPHVPLMAGAPVEDQILTQPPEVTWDGKLLTIDTENSTLTDILMAVRSATGASVEVPGSAATERVALHIGPAPIRDVLSALLYGTNFDYIIQASADDEDSLRSMIVTEHGRADDILAADGAAAPSPNPTVPPGPGVRMMRGWGASGKTEFQVKAEAALAEKAAAEASGLAPASDSPSASENASTQDAPATSDSASTAQGSGTDSASAAGSPDADQPSSPGLAPTTNRVAALTNASSAETSTGSAPMGQMMQDLQRMYQQRQQIQAEQNKAMQNAQHN